MKSTQRLKRSLQKHIRAQSLTEASKTGKAAQPSPQASPKASPTTNQSYGHVRSLFSGKPKPQQSLVDFWFTKYVQEFYNTPKAKSISAEPGQPVKPRVARRLKPQSFAAAEAPPAVTAADQFALQLKIMRLCQCVEVLSRKVYRRGFDCLQRWKRRLRRSRKLTRSNVPQPQEELAPVLCKHQTPRNKRKTLQTPKKKRLLQKKKVKLTKT